MWQYIYDTFINPKTITPVWFVWAGGSITMLWFFVWWSIGLFPTAAFGEGFSRAEQTNRLEARYIEEEAIDTVARRCQAVTLQSSEYFTKRLQEKQIDYQKLTGKRLDVPSCKDLGYAD